MQGEIAVIGLSAKFENLVLKQLKKTDYKSFLEFSKEYDKYEIPLEEYLQLQASKEFLFLQCGKLTCYLFEKQTDNRFESGEIVGYFEITPNEQEERTSEVGYYIKESKRKQGYAKKMLGMAIALCEKMEYEMLMARVSVSNLASVAVLKSGGFVFEANGEEANSEELQATLKIWR